MHAQARRIVSVIPATTEMLFAMGAGDRVAAAKIVTGDLTTGEPGHPDFLNTVVKQMAMKMIQCERFISGTEDWREEELPVPAREGSSANLVFVSIV